MVHKSVPSRVMREQPDLDQLKRQAKELLEAFRSHDANAIAEVTAFFHDANPATFALHDAQLVLARAYGFSSWPRLKAYVDGVTVGRLIDAVRAGNQSQVQEMLNLRPELACMHRAENDEHQALHYAVLERNAEIVRVLMRHGADARRGIYPHRDATSAYTLAVERGYNEIVRTIEDEEQRRPQTRWRGDDRGRQFPVEFEQAARQGNEDRIIAFLENDSSLQHANDYLLTPLHRAVSMLWERVAVWLLDHGADVNVRIDGGPSPLEIVGCGFGPGRLGDPAQTARIVDILRSRGAAMTPRAAVAYGEGAWLQVRHAEGKLANGLPKNQGYRGLLEIAVYHNRPDMLELLLDLGFDPDEPVRKDPSNEYARYGPLTCCVRTGRIRMAEMLVARGATLTPWSAVFLGKGEWLRAQHAAGMLENLVDTDRLRQDEGGGLISMAVKHERPDMLQVLLDLGLDPDERVRLDNVDEAVYTAGGPLHHCAGSGEHAMAEMLLKHGADPNAQVYATGSPIWRAYRERDTAMIELLRRYGAIVTPDIAGYLRDTPLALRIFEDEDAGRLPAGTVPEGKTVAEEILDPAVSGGAPDILKLALDRLSWPRNDRRWSGILRSSICFWHHIPWIRSPKWDLDRTTYLDCFRMILDRADPNLRAGQFGQTPLHEVAAMGNWVTDEEVVQFASVLLDAGARTDVRDDLLKSTPLGWACRWGRVGMVKLLIERGADPVEIDAEPWAKPRVWAEKMKHGEVLDVLRLE